MKRLLISTLSWLLVLAAMAQDADSQRYKVLLETSMGNITLVLYNETPQHRDNFLRLVREGYYDGNLWHRVIFNFMIQTGDSTTRHAQPGASVGQFSPDYTIPAEIVYPQYFHKRGALAAAREGDAENPERASSASQFYIVYGSTFSSLTLDKYQQRIDEATGGRYKMTEDIRDHYRKYGGTPHLDGQYTVFGEVVDGMDVVRKIQTVQTDDYARPVDDVRIVKATAIEPSAQAATTENPAATVGKRTEALDELAWDASQWISVADAPVVTEQAGKAFRAADGASWFVTTIKNEKEVVSARWMTTGLGIYELYVNGQPVGEEVLKPGFTHYAKTKRSFTYDITEAFQRKAGKENTLAAQVTPGWWADRIITPGGHEGMLGRKCAFRAVLELTFTDGTQQLIGTDCDRWRAGMAGPVRHAAIFDGEEYDARELPGFAVADRLSKPEVNTEFTGDILPSDGAEVYLRRDLTLKPVKAYVWEGVTGEKREEREYGRIVVKREYNTGEIITVRPGETLVVDFGQNSAAVPSFVFKAAEGTVLTCLPGEILNDGNGAESRGMDGPGGSVHRRNLREQERGIRLCYTFGGIRDERGERKEERGGMKDKGFVSFEPHSTFFGYRYVSITATDEVLIQSVVSVPVTSIAATMETGTLTTGNDLVNRLIANTLWGQRSNYLSVPTDCPQRDERLGWTADTQVFAEAGTFFANTDRFFHKWMRDMRDTQSAEGGFPSVAPYGQYGSDDNCMMRLGWADAGVIVPWTVWKQFGDTDIIEENWTAMDRFMQHIYATHYDHETLRAENGGYQWADWLSYEPLESCSGRWRANEDTRRDALAYWNYLSASYWAIDATMMRDMAQATGRDAALYQRMADDAKDYLRQHFLDADGRFTTEVFNTMQTPALFALKNELLTGGARDSLIARLRQNFREHDGCLQTGFLGTSILLPTLTENGMGDIAYELLFQRKNPSWLYSVDNGATTIWERWNSYTIESGMGPNGMNSFNHYAYGCVCQWLWETVAGIAADTDQPGFRHILMRPIPDKRLGHVAAAYPSASGLIKSAWRYDGDVWTWEFTIPEGATASVTLPSETESKEYTAGSYTVSRTLR